MTTRAESLCTWVLAPALLLGIYVAAAALDQQEQAMHTNSNSPRLDDGTPLTAADLAAHLAEHPPCALMPPNLADFCVVDLPSGYEPKRTGQHTTSALSRWWLRLMRALT